MGAVAFISFSHSLGADLVHMAKAIITTLSKLQPMGRRVEASIKWDVEVAHMNSEPAYQAARQAGKYRLSLGRQVPSLNWGGEHYLL